MKGRLLLAIVTFIALVLIPAAPADAHAELESTSPGSGAVLESSPTSVSVRFDDEVDADEHSVRLYDGRGRRVEAGAIRRLDGGRTLRLPVRDLPNGGYVLTWRVESVDGHPISGGVTWRIGAAARNVEPSLFEQLLNAEGGDAGVRAVAATVRAVLFASLLVLVGGLVFVIAIWPAGAADRKLRVTLACAAAVGLVTTLLGMGLQGADVAGSGIADAFTPSSAFDTLDTSFGKAALARVLLLAIVALIVGTTLRRARQRWWQAVTLSLSAFVLLTVTLSGHARSGRWLTLAGPIDLVHLGAASVWIGGLVILTLVVLPRRDEMSAEPIARAFSSIAALAVVAVVATGVVQGLRQLDGLDGLRSTSYGRLLTIKVILVVFVLVLGAFSRSRVRAGTAGLAVRRSVMAEAAIGIAVVAMTSLLVAANPSVRLEDSAFMSTKLVDGALVEAVASPDRAGPVDFHLYLSGPPVGLTTPLETSAELSLLSDEVPALELDLEQEGRAHWSAYDVEVPIRGRWRLIVTVRIGTDAPRRAMFDIAIH